jgi:hypothetical protein
VKVLLASIKRHGRRSSRKHAVEHSMLEDEAETAEESALPGWHVHVPTFRLTHHQFAVCTYYAVCMDPMGLPKTLRAIAEA